MADTLIRNLVLIQEAASRRQDALMAAEDRGDLTYPEWSFASRIWSRQHDALAEVILAEPPRTFDDVLTVLIQLDKFLDVTISGDPLGGRELARFYETVTVAVKNCTVALAARQEPPDALHADLDRLAGETRKWAPPCSVESGDQPVAQRDL